MPQQFDSLCITFRSDCFDGSSATNVAQTISLKEGEEPDATKLAYSVAQAIEQHIGNPLRFIAQVIQNMDVPRKKTPDDWKTRLIEAANAAEIN